MREFINLGKAGSRLITPRSLRHSALTSVELSLISHYSENGLPPHTGGLQLAAEVEAQQAARKPSMRRRVTGPVGQMPCGTPSVPDQIPTTFTNDLPTINLRGAHVEFHLHSKKLFVRELADSQTLLHEYSASCTAKIYTQRAWPKAPKNYAQKTCLLMTRCGSICSPAPSRSRPHSPSKNMSWRGKQPS